MIRTLSSLRDDLLSAARGLGFDEKNEKPLETGGRMRVRVFEDTDGDALTVLRLEVAVSLGDAPVLRIARRTIAATFWAAMLGHPHFVETGDEALDKLAVVDARERETLRTRAAVKAGLGAVGTELLREHPEAFVAASKGELVIGFEAREACMAWAVDLARRAAAALDASRIKPQERDATVRCGFCHGDFEPDEKSVRCDRCAATVHEGCWNDHEGCPALGCAGAAR